MRRLVPLLALVLAASAALPWAGSTAAASPTPAEVPTSATSPAAGPRILLPGRGCLYHGVYPGGITGEEDDIRPRDVAAYEAATGHRVAWVYLSNNWYRREAFPARTATWIRDRGSVPFIRLMLRSAIRGFAWWNETWQNDIVAAHDTDRRVQAIEGMPAVFQARLASPRVVDRPVIGQAGDPVPACEG